MEKTATAGFEIAEEFETLDPPQELRAMHEESVRQTRESRKDFETMVGKVRLSEQPIRTLQSELKKLVPDINAAEQLNRKLGLDECNEVRVPSPRPDES